LFIISFLIIHQTLFNFGCFFIFFLVNFEICATTLWRNNLQKFITKGSAQSCHNLAKALEAGAAWSKLLGHVHKATNRAFIVVWWPPAAIIAWWWE